MTSCHLCGSSTFSHVIQEEDHSFCCPGCSAVFKILASQNVQGNFVDQALFKQAVKYGLIANSDVMQSSQISDEDTVKLHLEILEMWCPSCADLIKLILCQFKGVRRCIVDYATDLASIEYSPKVISKDSILKTISSLGYQPHLLHDATERKVSFLLYLRLAVAFFCVLNLMMFSYPLYATYFDIDNHGIGPLLTWISFGLSLPVITFSAWPIFRRFWHSFLAGFMGMEALVVIGVVTSFGVSLWELLNGGTRVYFDSLSVIIMFVLLGKLIESKAKLNTKECLIRLNLVLPRRGRKKFATGEERFVPVKDILTGDPIVVLSGEKIVLDGKVISGEGLCDESLMTGESMPVFKKSGVPVIAGTVVTQGRLIFEVTATQHESALQKIIEMIEKDLGHKSSYVRAADLVVTWFVPVLIILALATGLICWSLGLTDGKEAFLRALAVLLISCPCAIGIAAPLAESYLIHALAQSGAIVRNRAILSVLGKETAYVFDKTGTVTEGKFKVVSGLEVLSESYLGILKGLVTQSIHPISQALSEALPLESSPIEAREFPGYGLQGVYQGETFVLGSAEWIRLNGVTLPSITFPGHSIIYFGKQHDSAYPIILGDVIRPEITTVLKELYPTKTVLLSGDANSIVQYVAQACSFDVWKGGSTPLQKKAYLEDLRNNGEIVAMLGDGINDAPALAVADIAVSVMSASDLSIQVSDVLLTTHRLSIIPTLRNLGKKGQRIIKQNLFWAFFYNIIGIGLAIFGALTPVYAAFAMISSSLMVLLNAQRLRTE